MTRNRWLRLINSLLLLALLLQVGTAIFAEKLGEATFLKIHPVGGWVLTVLVITHLALNWNWVVASFGGKKRPVAAKNTTGV